MPKKNSLEIGILALLILIAHQQCCQQFKDQLCVLCPQGMHLYRNNCIFDLPNCIEYESGFDCKQCQAGWHLDRGRCSHPRYNLDINQLNNFTAFLQSAVKPDLVFQEAQKRLAADGQLWIDWYNYTAIRNRTFISSTMLRRQALEVQATLIGSAGSKVHYICKTTYRVNQIELTVYRLTYQLAQNKGYADLYFLVEGEGSKLGYVEVVGVEFEQLEGPSWAELSKQDETEVNKILSRYFLTINQEDLLKGYWLEQSGQYNLTMFYLDPDVGVVSYAYVGTHSDLDAMGIQLTPSNSTQPPKPDRNSSTPQTDNPAHSTQTAGPSTTNSSSYPEQAKPTPKNTNSTWDSGSNTSNGDELQVPMSQLTGNPIFATGYAVAIQYGYVDQDSKVVEVSWFPGNDTRAIYFVSQNQMPTVYSKLVFSIDLATSNFHIASFQQSLDQLYIGLKPTSNNRQTNNGNSPQPSNNTPNASSTHPAPRPQNDTANYTPPSPMPTNTSPVVKSSALPQGQGPTICPEVGRVKTIDMSNNTGSDIFLPKINLLLMSMYSDALQNCGIVDAKYNWVLGSDELVKTIRYNLTYGCKNDTMYQFAAEISNNQLKFISAPEGIREDGVITNKASAATGAKPDVVAISTSNSPRASNASKDEPVSVNTNANDSNNSGNSQSPSNRNDSNGSTNSASSQASTVNSSADSLPSNRAASQLNNSTASQPNSANQTNNQASNSNNTATSSNIRIIDNLHSNTQASPNPHPTPVLTPKDNTAPSPNTTTDKSTASDARNPTPSANIPTPSANVPRPSNRPGGPAGNESNASPGFPSNMVLPGPIQKPKEQGSGGSSSSSDIKKTLIVESEFKSDPKYKSIIEIIKSMKPMPSNVSVSQMYTWSTPQQFQYFTLLFEMHFKEPLVNGSTKKLFYYEVEVNPSSFVTITNTTVSTVDDSPPQHPKPVLSSATPASLQGQPTSSACRPSRSLYWQQLVNILSIHMPTLKSHKACSVSFDKVSSDFGGIVGNFKEVVAFSTASSKYCYQIDYKVIALLPSSQPFLNIAKYQLTNCSEKDTNVFALKLEPIVFQPAPHSKPVTDTLRLIAATTAPTTSTATTTPTTTASDDLKFIQYGQFKAIFKVIYQSTGINHTVIMDSQKLLVLKFEIEAETIYTYKHSTLSNAELSLLREHIKKDTGGNTSMLQIFYIKRVYHKASFALLEAYVLQTSTIEWGIERQIGLRLQLVYSLREGSFRTVDRSIIELPQSPGYFTNYYGMSNYVGMQWQRLLNGSQLPYIMATLQTMYPNFLRSCKTLEIMTATSQAAQQFFNKTTSKYIILKMIVVKKYTRHYFANYVITIAYSPLHMNLEVKAVQALPNNVIYPRFCQDAALNNGIPYCQKCQQGYQLSEGRCWTQIPACKQFFRGICLYCDGGKADDSLNHCRQSEQVEEDYLSILNYNEMGAKRP